MSRRLLVAASIGAFLSLLLVSVPAEAATYKVSLSLSAAQADTGKTIKLTGAVSGSKAAKKTVWVQRKVGSGAWTTIAKPKTNASKKYAYTHTVSAAGAQQFRVVAPKKGSVKQGVSPSRSLVGWKWLLLAQQSHWSTGAQYVDTTRTIDGVSYPHSLELIGDSSAAAFIHWNLSQWCDHYDVRATLPGGIAGSQTFWVTSDASTGTTVYGGEVTRLPEVVGSFSTFLRFGKPASGSSVVVLTPRVHCRVAALPDAAD